MSEVSLELLLSPLPVKGFSKLNLDLDDDWLQ